MSLKKLRKRAAKIGVLIEADRDDTGWGYWLIDEKTQQPVWDDDNFCSTHDEIEYKLTSLENERHHKSTTN